MSPASRNGQSPARDRVLFAGVHPLILEDSRTQVEAFYEVDSVSQAGDELVLELERRAPDALVLDLLHVSSLRMVSRLGRSRPSCRIIVLTGLRNGTANDMAFTAGASGIIYRLHASLEIRVALAAVLAGRRYVSPALSVVTNKEEREVKARRRDRSPTPIHNHRFLLRLLEKGCSVPTIAEALGLSTEAVRRAIANLTIRVATTDARRRTTRSKPQTWAAQLRALRADRDS
ncbi:hypothetical protein YTPLAS18_04570 [Nitrospira sp.]|nr:hypothetical protein YTPLAS18_04570 [Nitrospira sp.]